MAGGPDAAGAGTGTGVVTAAGPLRSCWVDGRDSETRGDEAHGALATELPPRERTGGIRTRDLPLRGEVSPSAASESHICQQRPGQEATRHSTWGVASPEVPKYSHLQPQTRRS